MINLKKTKNYFWSPKKKRVSIYNYRVQIITLIFGVFGLVVALVGFWVTYRGLLTQLKEINSKAIINLEFELATSPLEAGPTVTEPLDISVHAHNYGDYNTAIWGAVVMFDKKVDVLEFPPAWMKIDDKTFYFRSKDTIVTKESLFFDVIDSVGYFKIIVPVTNNIGQKIIPTAIYSTFGEKSDTVGKVIFFDLKSGKFEYETLEMNNDEVITDLKGGFGIQQN